MVLREKIKAIAAKLPQNAELRTQLSRLSDELGAANQKQAELLTQIAALQDQLGNVGLELHAARIKEAELEGQLGLTEIIKDKAATGNAVECPSIFSILSRNRAAVIATKHSNMRSD